MQLGTLTEKLDSSPLKIALISVVILTLGLAQDFIHSSIHAYNFYWSESLLFNSYWLLFLPITALQQRVLNQIQLTEQLHRIIGLISSSLLSTALHVIAFPLVIYTCSSLFLYDNFSLAHGLNYIVSELLYTTIGIYALISLFSVKQPKLSTPPTNHLEHLTVRHKGEMVVVNTKDIISIHSESPYIKLVTQHGSYLHSDTLKSMMAALDSSTFARVHKSSIVNIDEVVNYKSRLNGDYDITLSDGSVIRLSRNYSSQFKASLS